MPSGYSTLLRYLAAEQHLALCSGRLNKMRRLRIKLHHLRMRRPLPELSVPSQAVETHRLERHNQARRRLIQLIRRQKRLKKRPVYKRKGKLTVQPGRRKLRMVMHLPRVRVMDKTAGPGIVASHTTPTTPSLPCMLAMAAAWSTHTTPGPVGVPFSRFTAAGATGTASGSWTTTPTPSGSENQGADGYALTTITHASSTPPVCNYLVSILSIAASNKFTGAVLASSTGSGLPIVIASIRLGVVLFTTTYAFSVTNSGPITLTIEVIAAHATPNPAAATCAIKWQLANV